MTFGEERPGSRMLLALASSVLARLLCSRATQYSIQPRPEEMQANDRAHASQVPVPTTRGKDPCHVWSNIVTHLIHLLLVSHFFDRSLAFAACSLLEVLCSTHVSTKKETTETHHHHTRTQTVTHTHKQRQSDTEAQWTQKDVTKKRSKWRTDEQDTMTNSGRRQAQLATGACCKTAPWRRNKDSLQHDGHYSPCACG